MNPITNPNELVVGNWYEVKVHTRTAWTITKFWAQLTMKMFDAAQEAIGYPKTDPGVRELAFGNGVTLYLTGGADYEFFPKGGPAPKQHIDPSNFRPWETLKEELSEKPT